MPDTAQHVHPADNDPNTVKRPPLRDGQILVDGEVRWDPARRCRSPHCRDTDWGGRGRVHMRGNTCPPDTEGRHLDVRPEDSPTYRNPKALEGAQRLAERQAARAHAVAAEQGQAYVAYLRHRRESTVESALSPELGETVIFWNRHGFPRTAHVIGTQLSLIGEQHCQGVDSPTHLHLHVLSPLAYDRWEMNVPRWTGEGPRAGTWSPR